jgi:hypothetical protein
MNQFSATEYNDSILIRLPLLKLGNATDPGSLIAATNISSAEEITYC